MTRQLRQIETIRAVSFTDRRETTGVRKVLGRAESRRTDGSINIDTSATSLLIETNRVISECQYEPGTSGGVVGHRQRGERER